MLWMIESKTVIWKLEDILESHISAQILSQMESPRNIRRRRRGWTLWEWSPFHKIRENEESERSGGERDILLFSINLQDLRHDVDTFIETLKEMEEEYIYEVDNLPEEKEESNSSRIGFGGSKSKMIGLSDQFERVKGFLAGGPKRHVSLIGMAGIGKTTLAEKIFEDPLVVTRFERRAWVRVGRINQFNETSLAHAILAQLDPSMASLPVKEICDYFQQRLGGERCLIVLDDIWDTQILDYLISTFPVNEFEMIRILLTARERNVATHINRSTDSNIEVVRFLNEEESMNLLGEKVFGEGYFPLQLEKAAKKIVKNCEGLPLLILTVAGYLSEAEKTQEYWNEVAQKKNSVFVDAYNDISKVLFSSYEYLAQDLKMLFLYMGAFPQDYEVPRSKLTNILSAEGFLEPHRRQTLEEFVEDRIHELAIWRNLVIVNQQSKSWFMKMVNFMKTSRIHSAWRHLCQVEASKRKIFHVLSSSVDGTEQCIEGQRRLCMYKNNTFCFKEVHNSVKCGCATTARSLLCFGPYNQYPMPIDVGFKLLRVLDALKVRFYHFPTEILQLVQLQYLALTGNKILPASISKLVNLQFLIIHPHMSIKYPGDQSLIPIQIWDMQELKHIEILGSCLPNPGSVDSLKKLFTLLGVSVSSCTSDVS